MQLNVKRLDPNAVLPTYSSPGAAALDLVAVSEMPDLAGGFIEYGTGLAVEIPDGFVGLIFPRSSISSATTMMLANSVGVVDSDYRGEIKFRFRSLLPAANKKYKVGEKIGQLMIVPYPTVEVKEVEELSVTIRGEGGFGSTGK